MNLDFHLTGLADIQRSMRGYGVKGQGAFAAACYLATSNIITTAMKLTPFATGFLRKSRWVERPVVTGNGTFSITFGFSAPYAVFVHQVNKRYFVGEWKYLETAINWHRPRLMSEITRWTHQFIASGKTIADVPEGHPAAPTTERRPRFRLNRRQRAKREAGRAGNEARKAGESRASIDAQRAGRRAARPGRYKPPRST